MAEQKILVDLNLNGQQIKDFVVDAVASLPSTGAVGRLIYVTGTKPGLYVMKSTGWTLLEDAGTVKIDAADTTQSYLDSALVVKAPGLLKRITDYGGGNKVLVLENDHVTIKVMNDVKWYPSPGSNALFGYNPALGKFVPVVINDSLKITTTNPGSANEVLSIGVRKISTHHSWAIQGAIEKKSYLGFWIRKLTGSEGTESILTKGLSVQCGTGTCTVVMQANADLLQFQDGSSVTSNITVSPTAKQLKVAANYGLQDQQRVFFKVTAASTNCTDLAVTLWLLQD